MSVTPVGMGLMSHVTPVGVTSHVTPVGVTSHVTLVSNARKNCHKICNKISSTVLLLCDLVTQSHSYRNVMKRNIWKTTL